MNKTDKEKANQNQTTKNNRSNKKTEYKNILEIKEGEYPFKAGEGDLGAFREKSPRVNSNLGKFSLTEKQATVLDFISRHVDMVGFPPTVRQIADYFGISPKAAHDHLRAIAKKGYLRLFPGSARGMELIHPSTEKNEPKDALDVIFVPLVGSIAAGVPILAEENIETNVPLPKSFLPQNGTFFALRVKGDSMVNAGIMDGDISVIQRIDNIDNEVKNGDIVAAMIDSDATLKTFHRTENSIILKPENDKYKPILLTSRDHSKIIGKLTGVYRKY